MWSFVKRVLRPWVLAWLFALAFLACDSVFREHALWSITTADRAETLPPPADAASPTGYQFRQHNLILRDFAYDGYQWMLQAERVLAGKAARVHWVDHDNAPGGRPAHWSSGLVWWLAGLAWIDSKCTGSPPAVSLERVATYGVTLLLFLLLLVLTPIVAWRMGGLAALALSLGVIGSYPLYESFVIGYPDHHGLVASLAMLTSMLLLAGGGGWTRVPGAKAPAGDALALAGWLPERRVARRWFVASGIAGGAALWVSAATQALALFGIGIGALASSVLFARSHGGERGWKPDPTLWRAWGAAGALASLGFYLLEYFPGDWSLRLEVNHPLYALAWLGAGDFICRCGRWAAGARGHRGFAAAGTAADLLALAALPLVILLTRERTFVISDPFIWALHADSIIEFQTLMKHLSSDDWLPTLVQGVSFSALGALTLLAALPRGLERPWKSLVVLAWCPAALALAFGCFEIRWLSLAGALSAGALAATGAVLSRHAGWARGRMVFVILVAAAATPSLWRSASGWDRKGRVLASRADLFQIVMRDVAHRLRQRTGGEEAVLLTDPSSSTLMIFFGGFRGLGTLYWENRDGLRASAEILGAASDDEALALVKKYNVKYIVDFSWDLFAERSARLIRGLRPWDPPPPEGLLSRLRKNRWPQWLRPIPYKTPPQLGAESYALIFEVVPDQSREEACVRAAQYLIAMGQGRGAAPLLQQALAMNPRYLPALVALAGLLNEQNDAAGFDATAARVRPELPAPGWLALDDRVNLVWMLMDAGDRDTARREFQAALDHADEAALRKLDAETLNRFLILDREWNLPLPGGVTFESVVRLMPLAKQVEIFIWKADRQFKSGEPERALATLAEVLRLRPDNVTALNGAAWILATTPRASLRNAARALELARRSLAIDPDNVATLDGLACAQALSGDFDGAVATEKKAIGKGDAQRLPAMRERLASFESRRPWIDPGR